MVNMRSRLPNIQPRFYPNMPMCLVCYDERDECVVGWIKNENLKNHFRPRVRLALTKAFYDNAKGSELTAARYK